MKDLSTLAKALASDQLKVRKRAQIEVENLLRREYTANDMVPTYAELLAICKGLHYTLWMQDKLLLKEEVVRRICNILALIPHPVTRLNYINAMFETLAREWDRLDNWRVDKFMLLTRDFFTQALQSLVAADHETWDPILKAVFDKILNIDVQHAVGLKMHMCTVLAEELSKKKVKSFCVSLALLYLISRLNELPRHHAYAHNILRVIYTLLGTLRRHSNPDTSQLIEKLTMFTNQRGKHFKSFRRIHTIVQAIANKVERRKKQSDSSLNPEQICSAECGHLPVSTILPDSTTTDTPSETIPEVNSVKRKKAMKKHKLANKKRRLTEDSTESIVDICSTSVTVQCEKATSGSEVSQCDPVEPAALDDKPSELSESDERTQGGCFCTPEPPATPETSSSLSTLDKSKRRVSFGKVFRKRFIASQRLSMTPTPRTTPKKGILRDGPQNGRISL